MTSDATLWQNVRYHAFAVYEKSHDIDRALAVIAKHPVSPELVPRFRAGLKGELILYDAEAESMNLDPSLDAGNKTDFYGIMDGRPVNIDVTTNPAYKDINDYAEFSQKRRRRLYAIACVDVRRETYEIFPLRFPLCENCQRFSHDLLFMRQPEGDVHFWASQEQRVVRHCPSCETYDELGSYNYFVDSPLFSLRDERSESRADTEEIDDDDFDENEFLERRAVPIANFFEKLDNRLLSGVAETHYVMTSSDGDGDWMSRLLWHHKLVRDLDDEISYAIG